MSELAEEIFVARYLVIQRPSGACLVCSGLRASGVREIRVKRAAAWQLTGEMFTSA